MGSAGSSAGVRGRHLLAQADEHERQAAELKEAAERWMLAERTERQVAGSLAPLTAVGYTFLHDRGWPGSSRANIDHVLVGPGGLFIVDTKAWADVTIAAGRIFRGQADVTDELDGLAQVGDGTEAVMAEIGLAPESVHVVIVLAGTTMAPVEVGSLIVVGQKDAAKFISSRGRRLTDPQVNAVLALAITHFPVLTATPLFVDTTILEPVQAEEVAASAPEVTVDDVADVMLAAALAESIESWMSFLHPQQAKLVRRSFNGPSRIRGAAGTGKTVVGLHRAAYLVRAQPKRVLVTSFVKTLPQVLSGLMSRLAPEASDRIDFRGVHAFALQVLRAREIEVRVDPTQADLAFDAAWMEFGLGGPLEKIDRNRQYWKDEISKVIKGRGLTTLDQYAELTRTGRRRPLTLEQRRYVWQLFVGYERRLRERGIRDFDDVILLAEASLRARPVTEYGAVIIDEAQDLSCAMVRMLHLLVGDAPDGLTIIGDGQQSIYPGGFTLAEAGVSITGRSVIMTTNYRNTREIMEFAARSVESDDVADIDGSGSARDAVTDVPRSGPSPVVSRFHTRPEHDRELVDRLRHFTGNWGDVGVLSLTSFGVKNAMRLLGEAGIPVMDLADYRGVSVDAVKVGTVKRAKGLEFKTVLLPRVRPDWIDPSELDDEARTIQRRELYVGMTRARDELWVGVCT